MISVERLALAAVVVVPILIVLYLIALHPHLAGSSVKHHFINEARRQHGRTACRSPLLLLGRLVMGMADADGRYSAKLFSLRLFDAELICCTT